jgi:flagellar hook protein FlgE
MGTALFTGVSALTANQRKLDVIASNIANVNTTGYRSARVLFQDLFSQTLSGAKQPVARFGGTNPQQVGLGIRIASIDVNFAQGSLFTTGNAADLAIQGSGFFILNSGASSVANVFTRDGSFGVDVAGRLTDPATGFAVQGFVATTDGAIDPTQPIQDLIIPVGSQSLVRPTENVVFTGNIDSQSAVGDTVERTVQVFDSLGTPREITFTFELTAPGPPNEWTWSASSTDPDGSVNASSTGVLTFDGNGDLVSNTNSAVTFDFNAGLATEPVDPLVFNVGLDQMTQLADLDDITVLSQDGFPRGTLELFNIAQDGVINGIFSNGLTQVLGQVAVATFANENGIERIGDNYFRDSPGSGNPQIGQPNTGGRGGVSGGVLERSNVDLAREFSELIITQRAFQANARTITTSDTLLQETVNLIR